MRKSYILHSPNVLKVEVVKRSKVRRNYLSYMRQRRGKSTRLTGLEFDKHSVNEIRDIEAEAEEEKLREVSLEAHEKEEAAAKAAAAAEAKKHEKEFAAHEAASQEVKTVDQK